MKRKGLAAVLLTLCVLGGCARDEGVVFHLGSGEESGQRSVESASATSNSTSGAEQEPTQAQSAEPAVLYVYVCGAVEHPDVYELPAGSRVFEAIAAAGGMTDAADPRALNLAEELTDGQQVIVFTTEEVTSGEAVLPASQESGSALVDLNRATREELMTLPGIGQTRAEAILAYREEAGGFDSIEEIKQISGIGEKSFAKLESLIKV